MNVTHRAIAGTLAALVSACASANPLTIRFAPEGTDAARLRAEFALSETERAALTPENLRTLSQQQVDQIYMRLSAGTIPDGPFRGDLFYPRDRVGRAQLRDLPDPAPRLLAHVATLHVERLGRALWRGKVFFRSEGLLRNRIEDLALLRPIIPDADSIPRLTFDGASTWLLFPARVSCGESRLDATRRSIVIDYSVAPQLPGYREIPDKLAGPDGLNIRDEVRIIRPGFYLGRAYFGERFALNFTLFDPAAAAAASSSPVDADCQS
jgi:hypothetical protein